MEVGISRGAPLLLNGGGNNGIVVKSKAIIGNGPNHPMRHRHLIDIKVCARSLS